MIYAVLTFTVAYLACLAWDFDHLQTGYHSARMRGWLVVAALLAVLSINYRLGADRGERRQFSCPEQFNAYRNALRTGQLPVRINPDMWRRGLRVSRGSNGIARLGGYLTLLLVVVPSLTHRPPYHPVFASLLAALAVWRLLASGITRARILKLADDVERRTGAALTPREAQMKIWFERPLAVRIFVPSLVAFSGALAISSFDRLLHGSTDSLPLLVGWAVVIGLAAAGAALLQLQVHVASFEERIALTRALLTGALPTDFDPEAWRNRLRYTRRLHQIEPWWACLIVLLALLPSLVNHSMYWVTAASFGLLATHNLTAWWRLRIRIVALQNKIDESSA